MIEKIVLDYLTTELPNVPVYMEEPPGNSASQYIIISKTAGSEENFISTATIAIQSYAQSLYAAASLNEEVKAAMQEIITNDSVSKCKLNSDYNFTNQAKKQYRYQAVFNLVFFN